MQKNITSRFLLDKEDFYIKKVLFASGERFPTLIIKETGMPDYWATLYITTQKRAKSMASNTIEQVLRQLMIFKIFLHNEDIDLQNRLSKGKLLDLHEIDYFCDVCRLQIKDIRKMGDNFKRQTMQPVSLEKSRTSNLAPTIQNVCFTTMTNRIRSARDYMVWLTNVYMAKSDNDDNIFKKLKESKIILEANMSSRISTFASINTRIGLSEDEISFLFTVVDRNSQSNPWKQEFTKVRNELIFLWLYEFGLRRGELLNLKVSDLDFRSETFHVKRRPDDEADMRRDQPLVKTFERKLPIPEKILNLTKNYIIEHRILLPSAKNNEFLFVATRSGKPMSLNALNKVFSQIVDKYPDSFDNLSPHILRHTWNDNFSKIMDNNNLGEEKEKKMRSYLMGWSPTSNTAAIYNKRFIQEKANQVLIHMSNKDQGIE